MDDTSNILFARLRCLRRRILLGWGLLAVFVICAVLSVTSGFAVGLVLCMLGFAGDLFFIMRSQKAYRRLFKERLVRSELEKQFGDLRYLPEAGIPASSIEQTGMMRMGNRYHAEDYLSGTAGGVPFEQSDVCIQNVTSNGKSTSTVTYFRGRWLIFAFNKRFTHNLLVVSDSFSYAKRPGGFFGKDRSERLSMESEAFNDAFKVYAQDAHEAYYILTPPLMERLLALNARLGCGMLFGFCGNRLHVAVPTGGDAFEPSLLSQPKPEAALEKIRREAELVRVIAEMLALDRRLFDTEGAERKGLDL